MVGIPVIFLTASVIEMSIEAWRFSSMMNAIQVAGRYACAHGRTCGKGGNSCLIKVKDVTNLITAQAPSLSSGQLNITLTTQNATVTCNPVSSCSSNTTQFPSSTDNGVGLPVTITATYPMNTPFPMVWFGSTTAGQSAVTLGATTTQLIDF
jgi:hypothetical protein